MSELARLGAASLPMDQLARLTEADRAMVAAFADFLESRRALRSRPPEEG